MLTHCTARIQGHFIYTSFYPHSVLTSSGARSYHLTDPFLLHFHFCAPLLMTPYLKTSLPQETVLRLQRAQDCHAGSFVTEVFTSNFSLHDRVFQVETFCPPLGGRSNRLA